MAERHTQKDPLVPAIWKFKIDNTLFLNKVSMPIEATILSVGEQYDELCIWAQVNPELRTEEKEFYCVATGTNVPDDAGRFLGTVLFYNGQYVIHVYLKGA